MDEPAVVRAGDAQLLVRVPSGVPLRWLLQEACDRISRRDGTPFGCAGRQLRSRAPTPAAAGCELDLEDDAHGVLAVTGYHVVLPMDAPENAAHEGDVELQWTEPEQTDEPPAALEQAFQAAPLPVATAMGFEALLLAAEDDVEFLADALGPAGAAALALARETAELGRVWGLQPPLDADTRLRMLETGLRGSAAWKRHQLSAVAAVQPAFGEAMDGVRPTDAAYAERLGEAAAAARLAGLPRGQLAPPPLHLCVHEALVRACWAQPTHNRAALQRRVARLALGLEHGVDRIQHAVGFFVTGYAAVREGASPRVLACLDEDSAYWPGLAALLRNSADDPAYLAFSLRRALDHLLHTVAGYASHSLPADALRQVVAAAERLEEHAPPRRGSLAQHLRREWGDEVGEQALVELSLDAAASRMLAAPLIAAALGLYDGLASPSRPLTRATATALLLRVAGALSEHEEFLREAGLPPGVVARQLLRRAESDVQLVLRRGDGQSGGHAALAEALARLAAAARRCGAPARALVRAEEQLLPMLRPWFAAQRAQFGDILRRCLQSGWAQDAPRRPVASAVDLLCIVDGAWRPVRALFLPDEVHRHACVAFAEILGDVLLRYGECAFHPDTDGASTALGPLTLQDGQDDQQMLRLLDEDTADARCRALAGALAASAPLEALYGRLQSLWFVAEGCAGLADALARDVKLREARAQPYHRPERELWRRARALAAATGARLATRRECRVAYRFLSRDDLEAAAHNGAGTGAAREAVVHLGGLLRAADDALTGEPYAGVAEAAVRALAAGMAAAAMEARFAGAGAAWFAADLAVLRRAAEEGWGVANALPLMAEPMRLAPLFAIGSLEEARALVESGQVTAEEAGGYCNGVVSSGSSLSSSSSETSAVCVVS